MRIAWLMVAALAGCGDPDTMMPMPDLGAGAGVIAASSSIALRGDGELWVVNPEADSVSVIDTASRALVAEIPLGAAPSRDANGRYEPAVRPRALAVLPGGRWVYVAGQSANRVYAIDATTRAVTASVPVGAAPTALVASADGSAVYVVCHEAGTVQRIDVVGNTVGATLPVGEHPWGASIRDARLYVTRFLLDPAVVAIEIPSLTLKGEARLAEQPPSAAGKQVPNGEARGLYEAVSRPGTGELWVPHLLLATKTMQPALDFESTVFPTLSTVDPDALVEKRRLLFQPLNPAGQKGAFIDSVSGPRAIAFTPDGRLALLALSGSEDVMVFDAERGVEVGLVRPLPSTFLEGIVVDSTGTKAYVDGRNTHDVTVLRIDAARMNAPVAVDGAAIPRLASDPMPSVLRLGQRLFYTANSAAFPITRNFWVSCASCHLEGGTDAVTWQFQAGPRDTPSNAGGPSNTGFLLRQALRNDVTQYDETINVEQGGNYHRTDPQQKIELDALADFVNHAIPLPQNPWRGASDTPEQARGRVLFQANCASCHSGAFYTDSAAGNPTLDLAGTIVLHDVGTCVTAGPNPDRMQPDVDGRMHEACKFDTPTLRGIFATPPYLHDGSARTLRDVLDRLPASRTLSDGEKSDLVEFLKTL